MTFSLHLSVDSCADIDDDFRGSSTSWLGGSLLVGGQRTGLCVCEYVSRGGWKPYRSEMEPGSDVCSRNTSKAE